MDHISPVLQTVFADLVQQVYSVPEKAGTVYKQTSNGADYFYAKISVGRTRRDVFLGPVSDKEALKRVIRIRDAQASARQRRGLVRALRDNGVPVPTQALGRVLDAMNDAGLFDHAVLVGTAAYICYSPVIGTVLPSSTLMTQDADLARATLAIAGDSETGSMLDLLRRADPTFAAIPGLKKGDPPSSFRSGEGFLVDLLTPQKRRGDTNPVPLENLQAGATPLQHLDWLIDEPVSTVALCGAGVPVSVPQPAKYAVHKLIVAQKRGVHDRVKRGKDLRQAKALIEALTESDPHILHDTFEDAFTKGVRGWRQPTLRSLKALGMDPKALL